MPMCVSFGLLTGPLCRSWKNRVTFEFLANALDGPYSSSKAVDESSVSSSTKPSEESAE